MKKIFFLLALSPFFVFSQDKKTDTPIPSTKKLQKIFQCPSLTREEIKIFYQSGDTFEVRLNNGSWGTSIRGTVRWEAYGMGYITALVNCDTANSPVEAHFPIEFTAIFWSCDSTILILEEYGAVFLGHTTNGNTHLIEICGADIATLMGFNIDSVRKSTEAEIKEYKKITGLPKPTFTYTLISKNRVRGKNEKMIFSRAGPLVSLKGDVD